MLIRAVFAVGLALYVGIYLKVCSNYADMIVPATSPHHKGRSLELTGYNADYSVDTAAKEDKRLRAGERRMNRPQRFTFAQ